MNDQQPVANSTEDADKITATSANTIHRLSASPRSIKTQIAKLTYPGTTKPLKKHREKKQTTYTQQLRDSLKEPEAKPIDTTRNEFNKKKEEREKEVKEFKSYINEITTNREEEERLNKDPQIKKNEEFKPYTITAFRRSKTEILGSKTGSQSERRVKARKGAKVRSQSSHPPDTNSHELLPSTSCITKRKSYNVEEARKFLAEQKRRRRSQQSTSALKINNEKTAYEKELIKKRLEDLRKNSKAILLKNVNRNKTPISNKKVSNADETNFGKTIKSKDGLVPVEPINKPKVNCGENINNYSDKKGDAVTIEELSKGSEHNPDKKVINLDNGAISENALKVIKEKKAIPSQKRVGLLRKPETKDHSFSAIKEFSFDKENIALEMMTPKLRHRVPSETNTGSKSKDLMTITSDQQEKPADVTYRKPINIKSTLETRQPDKNKNIDETEANEEHDNKGHDSIPINCVTPQSTLNATNENGQQNDLPYWLKPSAVQIYPYNFIMAVRRKLEALADVKQVHSQIDLKHHKTTSTKDLLSKRSESEKKSMSEAIKEISPQSIKQSNIPVSKNLLEESMANHSTETDKDVYQNVCKSKNYSTHSQSEVNSNISSISIQLMPSSNTVSRTLSKKSISIPFTYSKPMPITQLSEDDTTISSSIFNSPERNMYHKHINVDRNNMEYLQRSISPLSLERVENLTITPKKNLTKAIAARHVNTNRGDDVQSSVVDQDHAHNKGMQKEVDVNQLLDDFNRSLSQVIAVNDRLRTTINKTHEICGTQHYVDQNEPKESNEYSEDFEHHSSPRSQDTNSPLEIDNNQNHSCNKNNKVSSRNEAIKTFQLQTGVGELKDNPECTPANLVSLSQLSSNSSLYSHSRASSQKTQSLTKRKFSQHELDKFDKRALKIERIKEKVMQNIITAEKIKNSREGNFKAVIEEQENGTQTETPNDVSTSNTIKTEQIKNSKSESIMDNIQTEGKHENEQNMNHSKSPSADSREQKHPLHTLQKSEVELGKRQLLPKYLTASHKILDIFDSSSLEVSIGSTNNESLSDSTCSYSNVGLYEKLIRNETTKSEHLSALLKMREKALFDRTKGQIAWLEVQKERCKSKGLLQQITAIKKKQRGILLKMEKEREEIKRVLQSTTTTTSTDSYGKGATKESEYTLANSGKNDITEKPNSINFKTTQLELNEKVLASQVPLPHTPSIKVISKYPRSNSKLNGGGTACSVPVIRANYALESSRSLEELLCKREADLRRRREHVERLMQWHRQLDQEEAEVLQMENALLTYNTGKIQLNSIESEKVNNYESNCGAAPLKGYTKAQRRLKEIENSLRELSSISSTHMTVKGNECRVDETIQKSVDCARICGSKLNKLWRRLTSQEIEKYKPDKHYQLSKTDLEELYEAAKVAVLNDFALHEGRLADDLLEKSISFISNNISQTSLQQKQQEQVSIPSLNLCTSSGGPSNEEEESWEETSGNSLLLGNYSPSTAAENFNKFKCNSGSAILSSSLNQSSELNLKLHKNKSELNLYPNMRNSSHHAGHGVGLIRSLSDTAIYSKGRTTQDDDMGMLRLHENYPKDKSNGWALPKKQIVTSDNVENDVTTLLPLNPAKESLNELTLSNLNSVNEILTPALDSQTERPTVITATVITPTIFKDYRGSDECASSDTLFEHCTAPGSFDTLSQQEMQCSSQNISTCVDTSNSFEDNDVSGSHQNTSNIISSVSSLEQIKVDSNSSSIKADESNINQSTYEEASFNSKTFVNEPNSIHSEEIAIEKEALNTYEDDFENASDDLTQIEDLSLPHFESIVDISQPEDIVGQTVKPKETKNDCEITALDKCIQSLPECSGATRKDDPARTISGIMQSQPSLAPPPPPPISSTDTTLLQIAPALASNSVQLMPDIINELEIRRCQQILIESEKIKQFENSSNVVPYMYVREIPNKPPPPYVPPAHGSPMTTIFPSEERIKEISYRRTHELYCELLNTEYTSETGEKLPSVKEEKITNIYERIILDICREYLEEHSEVLTKGNPISFHTQLAFFNPPNRLRCIQESVYKEVRRCLAMDKKLNRRTPMYSVYGQRAKRDHIGKIIIQEMYDEDSKWCNFHREENEVVELIIYEMIGKFVIDIAEEVLLEEGGTVETSNKDTESESDRKQSSIDSEARQQVSNFKSADYKETAQLEEES